MIDTQNESWRAIYWEISPYVVETLRDDDTLYPLLRHAWSSKMTHITQSYECTQNNSWAEELEWEALSLYILRSSTRLHERHVHTLTRRGEDTRDCCTQNRIWKFYFTSHFRARYSLHHSQMRNLHVSHLSNLTRKSSRANSTMLYLIFPRYIINDIRYTLFTLLGVKLESKLSNIL